MFVYLSMKINTKTIKDAYCLLCFEDKLDCLNGVMWFIALDLMPGY